MLGAAKDDNEYYPETFFLRYDNAYIRNQMLVEVVDLKQTTGKGASLHSYKK